MSGIHYLHGVIKHYDWGGYRFIPHLLNIQNEERRPYAEYWLGTHSLGKGMVKIPGEKLEPLENFTGPLSYLLKVLDVRNMLSIQVHPSKEAASAAYAAENKKGIPADAPLRNYKDANHKPELVVALGDFWLLHGFKPPEELVNTLLNVAELRDLLPVFNHSGYDGLYKLVMEMPQAEVNRMLQPLLDNLSMIYHSAPPAKNEEDYWVYRAASTYNKGGDIDRGIFSIYLFNLIHLKAGEALYQAAGVPHAYLEGQNVEIMANSDNVLRGGLTTKHIDVQELLKHVKCEPTWPQIMAADQVTEEKTDFVVPVPDFKLSLMRFSAGQRQELLVAQAELLLITQGSADLKSGDTLLHIGPGQPAAVALSGAHLTIEATADLLLFRASGLQEGLFTTVNN